MFLERPFQRLPADPDPSAFPRATPKFFSPRAPAEALTVTWVGHASTLLQIGGLNLLTDPMWSERASPLRFIGPRRWVPPGIPLQDLPPIDAVLLSHNHYDHLDDRTVRHLARQHPGARWFAPLGIAEFLRARGVRHAYELEWWDETGFGDLALACVPAQHFSGRGLGDRNATLWCGWTIASGRYRAFFAGDTGYHPEFRPIAERHGPFDLYLMPVGAYEPRWFMKPAHMDPEEAVHAFLEMTTVPDRPASGRSILVPIHWGTFKLTDEAMDEPPKRTRRAWAAARLSDDDLWLLAHGETRALRPDEGG